MELPSIKSYILVLVGTIGGMIVTLLGGWDTALQTLLFLMATDYISGIILAGVFHKSKKTDTGSLSSKIGFKGICKKVFMIVLVMVGHRLDIMFDTATVRYGIIIAFCINELTSIIENAGLMGIPLPDILVQAIDLLKKKNPSTK